MNATSNLVIHPSGSKGLLGLNVPHTPRGISTVEIMKDRVLDLAQLTDQEKEDLVKNSFT